MREGEYVDSGNEIQGRKRPKKCPNDEKVPGHSWVANLQSNSSRLEEMEDVSFPVKSQTDIMTETMFVENLVSVWQSIWKKLVIGAQKSKQMKKGY